MKVSNNFPLSEITYYKIGGKAKFLLEIESQQDLLESLHFVQKNSIKKTLPLGLGSNVLINDKEFNGAVLKFVSPKNPYIEQIDEELVRVFASHYLDDVIQFGFDNGLIGLEWAGGLPSLVGAAVRGNVGAFGGEIKDSVEKVETVEKVDKDSGQARMTVLNNSKLQFTYRDSIIKQNKNLIVSTVYFRLKKAAAEEIVKAKHIYNDHIQYRQEHHPMDYPSCGSVFKNITKKDDMEKILSVWPDVGLLSKEKWHDKISMGYVINRLGFSGKQIGGAQVSEKHTNYIINKNNASFNEVVSLINEVKEEFNNVFGFYPEQEVEIVY
ncbi:MAG: UDP-N-acetylenolpyruvoylglucosamine reductase [Candidatus Levybacteria bacterium RIFCSPHIGHO2_12_FULL_38_12]|nr:MAG: UDP-N-acetylenolpyruvoylglucosamine reductase [Candidatus Levybacteria bacterium RIFCSPHIGHO2_12_FULL_38_12]OGH34028.1 MAG: UDP-N-acetylenolpyruvoylglucosamine reductase [Candidatus Levybacteria bacterium RIFCSPLOWO2_01_FULL_37_20]OGH44887.1 MAG: UDP-N-acetylenolpyruvoylglucosamine reductase [Candidatus Levybacteria bacterium RIFCSPLOWO2_02_FULL_37_18]